MRVIRGWEEQYYPEATGGVRLSKLTLYRTIGEEGHRVAANWPRSASLAAAPLRPSPS